MARITFKGPLARVGPLVDHEVGATLVGFVAAWHPASVLGEAIVRLQVLAKVPRAPEGTVTALDGADVGLGHVFVDKFVLNQVRL